LAAKTEEEVKAAFEEYGSSYADNFVPGKVSDILSLMRDPKFPKRNETQINFLADSLGGRPNLSPVGRGISANRTEPNSAGSRNTRSSAMSSILNAPAGIRELRSIMLVATAEQKYRFPSSDEQEWCRRFPEKKRRNVRT
jgi:hypothetical protein